jgi:hypothetical protein
MLGLWQTRSRNVARAQLMALPLALLALGLWGMAPGFVAQPGAAAGWLLALGAGLAAGLRLRAPAGARWQPEKQRLHLPGSWLPMALIAVIFSLRYGMGVAMALHPAWRSDLQVQLGAGALYGLIGGLLLGRAAGLLRLTGFSPATIGHGSFRAL